MSDTSHTDLARSCDEETAELLDGGRLIHVRDFLSADTADEFFAKLRDETVWEQLMFYGRRQSLLTKWIGDFTYSYSGQTRPPAPWNRETSMLRDATEKRVFGRSLGQFNGVLMNYYRSGSDQLGWHADNEPAILTDSPIASVSLGAARRFDLKHDETGNRVAIVLKHGSLLIVAGTTQRFWKHRVAAQRAVTGERINLTFRCYQTPVR